MDTIAKVVGKTKIENNFLEIIDLNLTLKIIFQKLWREFLDLKNRQALDKCQFHSGSAREKRKSSCDSVERG